MMSTVDRDSRRLGDDSVRFFVAVGRTILVAHLLPFAGTGERQLTSISAVTATHSMRFSGRLASQRMLSNQTALKLPAMYSRGRPSAVAHERRRYDLSPEARPLKSAHFTLLDV